jgi:hydroxyacylglutathione hydrolase
MRVFPHFVFTGFSNCYLVAPDGPGPAVLIDPGIFDGELLKLIEGNKLSITTVLITHTHDSHIEGIRTLTKIYDAAIYAFRDKVLEYDTRVVKQDDTITCGDLVFEVIELPGHSRDSLAFKIGNFLFTGDTLTAGLIGSVVHAYARGLLISSIKQKILTLDDDVYIFPGHGPPSTVGIERLHNNDLKQEL